MNNQDFKTLLKKANLSKKAFSDLIGTSSQVVNNWGNKDRVIPYWVDSWLNLYIENRSCKELKTMLKNSGLCDDTAT